MVILASRPRSAQAEAAVLTTEPWVTRGASTPWPLRTLKKVCLAISFEVQWGPRTWIGERIHRGFWEPVSNAPQTLAPG